MMKKVAFEIAATLGAWSFAILLCILEYYIILPAIVTLIIIVYIIVKITDRVKKRKELPHG